MNVDKYPEARSIETQVAGADSSYRDTGERRVNINAGSTRLMALFGILAFMYLVAPVVVPVALALYLNLLLSPIVRVLNRFGIHRSAGSAIVIGGVVFSIFLGTSLLAEPAQDWFDKMPKSYSSLKSKLTPVTEPLEDISELAETVDDLTTIEKSSSSVQRVTVQAPNTFAKVANRLPQFVLSMAIVLFLTYFFLSSNDSFLRKIVGFGKNFGDQRRILILFRNIQSEISNYVLSIAVINTGLGIAVALTMFLLDVPNPVLWGALAAILNFIPYLGAAVMAGIMLLVGITTFSTPAEIAGPALAYASLSILEGNLVTPAVIGKRLALQPSLVFISVVFWGWMWGIVGAALSIPIMVTLKIVLERDPEYAYLSALLQR